MKTERRPLTEKQTKDLQALFEHPGMEVLRLVANADLQDLLVDASNDRLGEDMNNNPNHDCSNQKFAAAKISQDFIFFLSRYGELDPKKVSLVTIHP